MENKKYKSLSYVDKLYSSGKSWNRFLAYVLCFIKDITPMMIVMAVLCLMLFGLVNLFEFVFGKNSFAAFISIVAIPILLCIFYRIIKDMMSDYRKEFNRRMESDVNNEDEQ